MTVRKGFELVRISEHPKDLAQKIKRMGEELNLSRNQIVERAIFDYIQNGCRSLMYRLEEIEERKKVAEAARQERLRKQAARAANPGRSVGRPKKPKPFNGLW